MTSADFYLDNWWLLLLGLILVLLFLLLVFHTLLRFPGITDWKFIMMNFEDHIQAPVKKFSQSLYGNLVLAGGVVVRKISIRNYSGGQNGGRTRKTGVCVVHFDPESLDDDELKEQNPCEKSDI